MRSISFFSLIPLGLALTTVAASSAEAQRRTTQIIVCRDGTRVYSDEPRVCARHRGIDVRATDAARRHEADRIARRNDRWDDRRDRRDDRRDRRDDRRDGHGYGGYGNGRGAVYEWQGTVDREIQIQLRGNRATVRPVGGGDVRSSRGHVVHGLPQRNGTLVVERLAGRGSVDVISQPSSINGYTATLRIRDPQGGAAHYRIVAYFEPAQYGDGRYDDRRYDDGRYGQN